MTLEETLRTKAKITNPLLRESFAEFLATFVLMAFGDASVAQLVLGTSTFHSVNWAWGIGVAMGVWVAGGVSGAHMNPAITLTFAVLGRLEWKKVPIYMIAQYLGSFIASACIYGIYYEALSRQFVNEPTWKNQQTASIFATYLNKNVSAQSGLGDQIFGTMLLVLCVCAITDKNNHNTPDKGIVPLCIGLVVVVIGMSYGHNCGYAINPARDFAPRLFTSIAGWSGVSFSDGSWFWIPIIGPHIGAILGALIYLLLVGIHLEEKKMGNKLVRKSIALVRITSFASFADRLVDIDMSSK